MTTIPNTIQQLVAVRSPKDTVIVTGGVRTGKTHVLLSRARELIDKGTQPSHMAFLTATPQSVSQFTRVIRDIHALRKWQDDSAPSFRGIYFGTFTNFAASLLRTEAWEAAGIHRDFSILTSANERSMALRIFLDMGEPDDRNTHQQVSQFLQWSTKCFMQSDQNRDEPADRRWRQVARRFESEKRHQHCVSYEETVSLLIRALNVDDRLRRRVCDGRTRFLFVDDFQDIVPQHYELVKVLSPHKRVTIAYDQNQSVYRWRGTARNRFHRLLTDYRDHALVELSLDLKTAQSLGTFTAQVKRTDPSIGLRDDGTTLLSPRQGRMTWSIGAPTFHDQASLVADNISLLKNDHEVPYREVAVLYPRSHPGQIRELAAALARRDIPSRTTQAEHWPPDPDCRRTLALLTLLENPRCVPSLSDVMLGLGLPYVEAVSISRQIESTAQRNNSDLIDACRKLGYTNTSQASRRQEVQRQIYTITQLLRTEAENGKGAADMATAARQLFPTKTVNSVSAPWMFLLSLAREVDRNSVNRTDATLNRFIDYVSAYHDGHIDLQNRLAQHRPETVTLSSIYAAKKDSYRAVFLINLTREQLPGSDEEDAEFYAGQSRLFYIGISRATEFLYLYAYKSDSGQMSHGPSPMLRYLDPPESQWWP